MAIYTPKVAYDWESRKPWTVLPFPEEEYRSRVARTRQAMSEHGLDALVAVGRVGDDAVVRWLSNFTPFLGQAVIVLLPAGEPYLFANMAMHGEPMHTLFYQTWFRHAELVPSTSSLTTEVVNLLKRQKSVRRIGLPGLAELPAYWTAALTDGIAGATLESADVPLLQMRAIKTPLEIAKMRQAAQISGHAIRAAMEACHAGVSEHQVAGLAHQVMFNLGAEDLAFDSAVVAGPRAGLKHGYPSARLMQEGDMVFLDMAAKLDGYHADLSRTMVIGEPNDYQRRMLETAEKLFAVWMKMARPGTAVRDIQSACVKIAIGDGFEEEHMPLGWGHGLGVSLFELPYLTYMGDTVLEAGMIFALEPMLVKLGIGTAVMEDTMLITPHGIEALSGQPTALYT
ncbi:MAG: M24 family metallopeptidase [Candidatus Dormibacteraceae bacterium]